jgi:hypothetical protein
MLTKAVDCSGGIEWAFEYGRQTNKFSIYGGSFPGGPVKYGTNTYPKNSAIFKINRQKIQNQY